MSVGSTHDYQVTVEWTGNTGTGTAGYRGYDRAHDVRAEGRPTIAASADPAFLGTPDRWNPEDLLVAALANSVNFPVRNSATVRVAG